MNDSPSSYRGTRFLLAMMAPIMMTVLIKSMFSVALPALRGHYELTADLTSWLVVAYILPFMLFMPLYGRLGDILGKGRLLLVGIAVFTIGSVLCLFAASLPLFIAGRIIQGAGGACANPLSLSLLADNLPAQRRGRAMGTFSSSGPFTFMIGPFLAGFMIQHLGWKSLFVPVIAVGVLTFLFVARTVPRCPTEQTARAGLRSFDWIGFLLLAGAVLLVIFFLSSRPITGRAPLRDWRLAAPVLPLLVLFVLRERMHPNPFVPLSVFSFTNFVRASACTSLRLIVVTGTGFLMPLFFTDIYGLPAASIGMVVMLHAASFLATMRLGGLLGDVWGTRWPVIIGLTTQLAALVFLSLQAQVLPLPGVLSVFVVHGLGAGFSLASLHRGAMSRIPNRTSGVAAGLYSMIRFGGDMLGAGLGGVILQLGLDRRLMPLPAYQNVFWFLAGVCVVSAVIALGLKD